MATFAARLREFTVVSFVLFVTGIGPSSSQKAPKGRLPDSATYLQAVSAREDAVADQRQKYLCIFENRKFARHSVRLYESFYIHGHEIRRLLAADGVPLSPEQKQSEEARVKAEMAADEAKPIAPFVPLAGGMYISPGEHHWAQTVEGAIVRAGKFKKARRVMYRGTPAIQIDFTGNPKFQPQTDEERIARVMSGTIIVDEESGTVVRVGAEAMESVYHDGTLLAWLGEQIGFDATRIAENLYFPSSWITCRSFPNDPRQITSVDCEDFWLQSCSKYTSESRLLPGVAPLN